MLLFRCLFLLLIPSFLLSMFIITFVLSMDTVYKLINMIIERGSMWQQYAAFDLSTPAVFKYDLALCESDVGCPFHVQTFN